MPLRSAGCFTCRRRKIRCDETRPHCRRCATHGVLCTGYRTEQPRGIEFKDQTALTKQRAKGEYHRMNEKGGTRRSSSSEKNSLVDTSSSTKTIRDLWDGPSILLPQQSMCGGRNYGMVTPHQLSSPAANRSQLYGTFLDIYLPKLVGLDHFRFFLTLASTPTTLPALHEALDSLSLVTLGNMQKDAFLIQQSLRSYGRSLRALATAIARESRADRDELFAAVSVLSTCALFDDIGNHMGAWCTHVEGSQRLIAGGGPKSIQSQLALLCFSNLKHAALCLALISREEPLIARSEWRGVMFRSPCQDSSIAFYDVALQIPRLLERHDRLVHDSLTTVEDIDALLKSCGTVEMELRDWFADWRAQSVLQGFPLYELRPIHDFSVFTSVCADRHFDAAFMFPDFAIAYLASLYWNCLHFVRSTISSLHRLRHCRDSHWYPHVSTAVTEEELREYAFNLCRCFPFFCEPIASHAGHVGIFLPLRTASLHFTSRSMWREARWVGAVRNSVFTKGLSPPNVRDPPSYIPTFNRLGAPTENWRLAFWQCNQLNGAQAASIPIRVE